MNYIETYNKQIIRGLWTSYNDIIYCYYIGKWSLKVTIRIKTNIKKNILKKKPWRTHIH